MSHQPEPTPYDPYQPAFAPQPQPQPQPGSLTPLLPPHEQQQRWTARRRRTRVTVVLILAAVLLASGAGYVVLRDGGPLATNLRVVAPDTLAGRPRFTDPAAQKPIDLMLSSTRDDPAVTSTVAAAYGDPSRRDLLAMMASTRKIANQDMFFSVIHGGMAQSGWHDLQTSPVEPGPYGGRAECGDFTMAEVPIGICMWVDGGSFGLVMGYFATGLDLEPEFITIRGAIEQSG
jgi:hypothetical protein